MEIHSNAPKLYYGFNMYMHWSMAGKGEAPKQAPKL